MMERAQGEPRQTNVTNLHVAVPVWSNDAIRVGDVSHIVVDPRRCTIQQLVVRLEGERAAERLVMVSQLEAVHDDKVVLRLAAR
jgi:sporulation protein YlmC with PRC-barrel domain